MSMKLLCVSFHEVWSRQHDYKYCINLQYIVHACVRAVAN